jgi:hypothetical protein
VEANSFALTSAAEESLSDHGLLAQCTFFQHLDKWTFIPPENCIAGSELNLQHVLLGVCMMSPHFRGQSSAEEAVFICRLSRARRTVECAFGMSAQLGILRKLQWILWYVHAFFITLLDMEGLCKALRPNSVSLECSRLDLGDSTTRLNRQSTKF